MDHGVQKVPWSRSSSNEFFYLAMSFYLILSFHCQVDREGGLQINYFLLLFLELHILFYSISTWHIQDENVNHEFYFSFYYLLLAVTLYFVYNF